LAPEILGQLEQAAHDFSVRIGDILCFREVFAKVANIGSRPFTPVQPVTFWGVSLSQHDDNINLFWRASCAKPVRIRPRKRK